VSDEARALVTFKRHDVLSGSLNPSVDLVLCRNLLIYFQKELQERALRHLHASLNPGGFLILGKTETITPQMLDYFEVVDLRERIYRKK
jgi:chemotaxis methyl-accepting protein methylase